MFCYHGFIITVTGTETSGTGSESTPDLQQRESVMATGTLGSSTEEQIDTSDVAEDELPRSSVPGTGGGLCSVLDAQTQALSF